MDYDVDINEMERQRYNTIKKNGKYIEVNILVGAEDDVTYKGHKGRMPVIHTEMHNCSSKDISCMYLSLKTLLDDFKEDYPKECLLGEIMFNCHDLSSVNLDTNDEEEE